MTIHVTSEMSVTLRNRANRFADQRSHVRVRIDAPAALLLNGRPVNFVHDYDDESARIEDGRYRITHPTLDDLTMTVSTNLNNGARIVSFEA